MSDCEDPIRRPHLAPVRDAFGHFSQINIKFGLDVDANEVDCSGDFLAIAADVPGSVSLRVILSCPLTPPPSTFSLLLLSSLSHFPAVPSSVSICSCLFVLLLLCSCHCRPLPLLCRSNYITAPVIHLRVMTWSSKQCFPPPFIKVEVGTSALGSDPGPETCSCPQGVWFGLFIGRAVKSTEHVHFTLKASPEKQRVASGSSKNADITSCCPGDD